MKASNIIVILMKKEYKGLYYIWSVGEFMNEIMLSIIIPVYNAKDYIDGIFAYFEKYNKQFELVFVDDCSNDGSYELLLDRADKSPLRTVVFKNKENSGAGVSRNNGIDMSQGQYITFLDSDDYFVDDYFEIVEPLLKYEYDMIVYDATIVGENLVKTINFSMFYRPIKEGLVDKKEALTYIKGGTLGKIYKRKYIVDYNIKFLDLKRNEDMPFTKIATAKADTIFYVSKALYCYYQNPNSLMHNDSLLTPTNAQKSFLYVEQQIGVEYPEEVEAIFLVEYLYSTVITNVKMMKKRELRQYICDSEKMYPMCYKSKYINDLTTKFKLILLLIRFKQIFLLKMIVDMKK